MFQEKVTFWGKITFLVQSQHFWDKKLLFQGKKVTFSGIITFSNVTLSGKYRGLNIKGAKINKNTIF